MSGRRRRAVVLGAIVVIGCVREPAQKAADDNGAALAARGGQPVERAAGVGRPAAGLASTPSPATPPSQARDIPLVPGLTVVTAIVMGDRGDGESVKQITAVDDEGVSLTYSADVVVGGIAGLLGGHKEGDVRQVRGRRRVTREDLERAREYMQLFGAAVPEHIPGSTALGVSAAVLGDLKTKGESPLTMRAGGLGSALGSLIGAFAGQEFSGVKELHDIEEIDKISGTIRRVESTPVLLRVLVNGKPADLPAVHARGELGEQEGDFYFLDDRQNPLTLKFTLGDDRLQVIKIAFPEAPAGASPPAQIALDLAERGRAEVYGIHFDFDSDVLRPESKPVLDEIAAALGEHADWKLSVEGHTDNVGTDAHNVDLSSRRAAAVKKALVDTYGIADARLAPAGFGATRPKSTNDTVEGRALNRRVELVRK